MKTQFLREYFSPLSNKTRLSQKERKKMRRSFEEQETVVNNACEPEQNGHNIDTSPVNPWYVLRFCSENGHKKR